MLNWLNGNKRNTKSFYCRCGRWYIGTFFGYPNWYKNTKRACKRPTCLSLHVLIAKVASIELVAR
uniref:Uncharacterized protein n=1 Tax=Ciona intestinalis TaxID=7719 RepID=H2XSU9_CIOIN